MSNRVNSITANGSMLPGLRDDVRQVVLSHCHGKTTLHTVNFLVTCICDMVEKSYAEVLERELMTQETKPAPGDTAWCK